MKCKNCKKEQSQVFCSDESRFLYKTKENPQTPLVHNSHCLEWTGYLNNVGYGFFCDSTSSSRLAHRWSHSHFNGDIPVGMVVNHICHNRACVNHQHLETLTPQQNLADNRHNNRRMTYDTVIEIRDSDKTAKEISKEYDISLLSAQKLLRGDTYKAAMPQKH
ncbi:HNH endonuclease signature motif containing protein [Acetobacter persici]|uniref:HNH endonuclease signature motif containing protein n=1 Tax=Acetobacter persici TaxID=1076596 RepID=UPI001BA85B31|nr:HNH endonuclease signature motif containing protein [Acetobacter persici]MBS1015406.1 HNH endonuclease [Acetobacter persici]